LTFDDGYRDYYTTAYPILHEFGVPAVCFLATHFIDTAAPFWWDRVETAVALSSVREVRLPWSDRLMPLTAAREIVRLAKAQLKQSAIPDESPALQEFLARLGFPDGPAIERQVMTWDEVRRTAALTTLGGHAHRHAYLPRLDESMVAAEIGECRNRIASETGVRPRMFAYPNGGWNDIVRTAVKNQTFEVAFTTQATFNDEDADPLLLGRFHAPTSAEKLAWLLSGWSKID
jgi:peptidoglycan/xylan/chitin deacetylase (PgdA/CDA1 family)